ncbi:MULTISPECIES: ATP-binding cassette domain-containing protein [Filomicrobium]|uniref:Tungstate transport system ATP-binding protein n=1 Tax=Filomicrobium insigne TaxID=418854 RepID=A0A1H0HX87_9HYPH|nr:MULTISPECIES: ATP-binding cassette domain-containing protein [Filomicrobium]MCV0368002.1 ATP-binding cassette domain-containing protein [Filomicrobium sp.]SDO23782.1 tungstate transport system ATP-binding protein [Filomicrobium insigne]
MLDAVDRTTAGERIIASKAAPRGLLPMEARGLTLAISGKRLVDAVDLDLNANSITMIMGPNGAGKSLLIRLLHGMITPTSGSITWSGEQLNEGMRRRQAMVFQRPVLLRRSVAANVDFVLSLRGPTDKAKRDHILEHVGLLEHAKQPARLLSGGEQQRLALARALALEPDVLFLDEPTASLDPASVLRIEQIVSSAHASGTKIIFITHDFGQAKRLAGDIVLMHRGGVLEHTPAEKFFEKPQTAKGADFLAGRIVL